MIKKKLGLNIDTEGIFNRINRFVQFNSFVITGGLVFTFLFLNYRISSLTETVEETLIKNTQFIKQNLNHPIFLSATGQVIVADKSPMSFYDDRFQQYLINNIVDNLVAGLVKISNNFTVDYVNSKELIEKYNRFDFFIRNFANGKGQILYNYASAVRLAIIENNLPEYIDVVNAKLENYVVRDIKTDTSQKEKDSLKMMNAVGNKISGTITIEAVVKSWIASQAKWDTKIVSLRISFKAVVETAKYAHIGNPFGIKFTEISVPVLIKPKNIQPKQKRKR